MDSRRILSVGVQCLPPKSIGLGVSLGVSPPMADQNELFKELLLREQRRLTAQNSGLKKIGELLRVKAAQPSRPRTFVGFSSTDRWRYTQMQGWNAHENIDVDFADCQLDSAIDSENEEYIKGICREHLQRAGTFVQLIGEDTARKYKYVRWEAEVAIEKECRIIAVNLDGWWDLNPSTCPPILQNVGAMFVPFSPAIVGYALKSFERLGTAPYFYYLEGVYKSLGYDIDGKRAIYRQRPKPWQR
jgi:hypothetical protein